MILEEEYGVLVLMKQDDRTSKLFVGNNKITLLCIVYI